MDRMVQAYFKAEKAYKIHQDIPGIPHCRRLKVRKDPLEIQSVQSKGQESVKRRQGVEPTTPPEGSLGKQDPSQDQRQTQKVIGIAGHYGRQLSAGLAQVQSQEQEQEEFHHMDSAVIKTAAPATNNNVKTRGLFFRNFIFLTSGAKDFQPGPSIIILRLHGKYRPIISSNKEYDKAGEIPGPEVSTKDQLLCNWNKPKAAPVGSFSMQKKPVPGMGVVGTILSAPSSRACFSAAAQSVAWK